MATFAPRLELMTALLLFSACAAAKADGAKERLSAPGDAEQRAAQKKIAEIDKGEYERAKTDEKKAALAKRMLADAMATKDAPAGRYVLLKITRDAAAQAGDPETA